MSVEAHRCNQKRCNGFVTFDNADFDFKNIPINKEVGCYSFDEPTCNVCGKEFLVIPHYMVVEITNKDFGEFEELESCCITEVERQKR